MLVYVHTYDTDNDGQFIMSYKCFYLIFNEIPIPDQTIIIISTADRKQLELMRFVMTIV